MITVLLRRTFLGFSFGYLLSGASVAAEHVSEKRKFSAPPSADLLYAIKASQHGIPISGDGVFTWRVAGAKYSVVANTSAMFIGTIMQSRSEGLVDEFGLAPLLFVEKNFRKPQTTTQFYRDRKLITFTESLQTYPIIGGEQDRTSVIWQLCATARAAPELFTQGSEWVYFVAGRRDAEAWTFKVIKSETLIMPIGAVNTLHFTRAPPPDSKGQQLDIWLGPSLDWYPVRIRFADGGGDFVEQKLEKIERRQ